jgi:hypothetical protein
MSELALMLLVSLYVPTTSARPRSFLSNGKETVLEVLRPFEEQNFDIAVLDDAQLQWIAMR